MFSKVFIFVQDYFSLTRLGDTFSALPAQSAQLIRAGANLCPLVMEELGRQGLLVQFLHCCYSL